MTALPSDGSDQAARTYRVSRRSHWDRIAGRLDGWRSRGEAYQRRLARIFGFLIPPGHRVLEIGCGTGELLNALEPALGVGVDLSGRMVARARSRHPHLRFVQCDAHGLALKGRFDVIILSDLVNDLWDVQGVLEEVARLANPSTRLIINTYSRMWEIPLTLAQRLGWAKPLLPQNWLTVEDLEGLLNLTNMEVVRCWREVVWPLDTRFLGELLNRYLGRLWPLDYLALTNFIVARPRPSGYKEPEEPSVSVVVPARNEAGNIPAVFSRTPEMGRWTELIFVEGHSTDGTYEAIQKELAAAPNRRASLLRQKGRGKGDAVRLGFSRASGDILMILDADLTMPPEHLPRFFHALRSGKGEFANGVRLVYPMEKQAMRFANLVGNKFFSLAFSWLLGQPIKDTLCGTKALWKKDYERIARNRSYFGDFDPFGDFDLLFGAARMNLKIAEIPIRYRERTYGQTNIQRWRHGWLLIRMVLFACRRMRFV